MTAEVVLRDHSDGTDYRITVRHGDPASRDRAPFIAAREAAQ